MTAKTKTENKHPRGRGKKKQKQKMNTLGRDKKKAPCFVVAKKQQHKTTRKQVYQMRPNLNHKIEAASDQECNAFQYEGKKTCAGSCWVALMKKLRKVESEDNKTTKA